MKNPYDWIGRIGLLLAIVGAVDWLLIGIFEWNFVKAIFTSSGTQDVGSVGERVVYIVVGVGGLVAIPMLAATLARSRSRDARHEDRATAADRGVDDVSFYLGAPKSGESVAERPSRTAEPEPVRMPHEATASPAGGTAQSAEERLRYGRVEEADEGFDEGYDQQRRAA